MAPKVHKKQRTSRASSSQTRNLLSSQPYAIEKKNKLESKEFLNSFYLDWSVMEEYGLSDTLQNLIEDKKWFKVFDMTEPAYKDLTIEVLSTLKVSGDRESDDDDDHEDGVRYIKFQAMGEVKKIPLRKMGVYLGYYADEDENALLPTNWPNEENQEKLWFELTGKTIPFEPSKSVNSHFARTEHKLLHHIIAHSLTCRKTSHSKLTTFDMFLLFSMIKGFKVDLGVEVANFIVRQSEDVRTNWIFCGGYITQLLKGMGHFQEPANDVKIPAKRISSAPFRSWGLVKVPRGVQQPEEIAALEIQPVVPLSDRPSSSSAPPPRQSFSSIEETLERLERNFEEFRYEFQQEKKKNKKFRSTLFSVVKSAFSCFNSTAAEKVEYDTSPEESDSSSEPES